MQRVNIYLVAYYIYMPNLACIEQMSSNLANSEVSENEKCTAPPTFATHIDPLLYWDI